MADRMQVTFTGGAELAARLSAVSDRALAGRALRKAVGSGANIVREKASQLAPRRSGNLARNIGQEVVKEASHQSGSFTGGVGNKRVVVDVGPTKEAWYGVFPELGTVHSAAKPFLRPALDESERLVLKEITNRLSREIDRVTR